MIICLSNVLQNIQDPYYWVEFLWDVIEIWCTVGERKAKIKEEKTDEKKSVAIREAEEQERESCWDTSLDNNNR